MSESLDALKKKLFSSSKGSYVASLAEFQQEEGEWLSSPAYDLNRILSGSLYKSIAPRNHTLLVGPEASFKSSFMALMLADATKKGYQPIVINAEGAWTPEWVSRWGLNPENVWNIQTGMVEEILVTLTEMIDSKAEKLAIAIDSIGALESKKMLDDGMKGDVKADQGTLQKKIKRMLKLIVQICKFQNSLAFSAGHYYGNPSGYGEPEQIGGGKYLRYSADTIVTLKKLNLYENPKGKSKAEKGKIIGTEIKAATIKNRHYPPFQEATLEIDYKNGVNELAGLISIGTDMGIVEKAGSWFSFGDVRVQGEKALEEAVAENPQKLLDMIETVLEDTKYSAIDPEIEKLLADPEEEKELLVEEEEEKPKKKGKK